MTNPNLTAAVLELKRCAEWACGYMERNCIKYDEEFNIGVDLRRALAALDAAERGGDAKPAEFRDVTQEEWDGKPIEISADDAVDDTEMDEIMSEIRGKRTRTIRLTDPIEISEAVLNQACLVYESYFLSDTPTPPVANRYRMRLSLAAGFAEMIKGKV